MPANARTVEASLLACSRSEGPGRRREDRKRGKRNGCLGRRQRQGLAERAVESKQSDGSARMQRAKRLERRIGNEGRNRKIRRRRCSSNDKQDNRTRVVGQPQRQKP